MGALLRILISVVVTIGALLLVSTQASARVVSEEVVSEIFEVALGEIGTPYCRGGSNGTCFDCSGFTTYVYKQVGIELPRSANSQYKVINKISREDRLLGDLVFFRSKSGYVYHVGIYAGDNKIIHSPKPNRSVEYEKIWSSNVSYGRMS